MTKRETIDRIITRNPSARPEFLAEFTAEDLDAYLRQLESVKRRSPHEAPRQTRVACPPCA